MPDPHHKTDAERALLDELNDKILDEWRRYHFENNKIGPALRRPAETAPTVAAGNTAQGHQPPQAGLQSHLTAGLGHTNDDPLAAARGVALAVVASIPFWIAAALGAWAAWRWIT